MRRGLLLSYGGYLKELPKDRTHQIAKRLYLFVEKLTQATHTNPWNPINYPFYFYPYGYSRLITSVLQTLIDPRLPIFIILSFFFMNSSLHLSIAINLLTRLLQMVVMLTKINSYRPRNSQWDFLSFDWVRILA